MLIQIQTETNGVTVCHNGHTVGLDQLGAVALTIVAVCLRIAAAAVERALQGDD